MSEKTRFDYSLVGLAKVDGVTKFNGMTIHEVIATNADKVKAAENKKAATDFLMNYGLFVVLTRTLAGHEKDSISEKKSLIQKEWDWLKSGCPKREHATMSAEEKAQAQYDATVKMIRDASATGTATEKKMAEAIIAKIPKPVKITPVVEIKK
jgi:hypothetical protein